MSISTFFTIRNRKQRINSFYRAGAQVFIFDSRNGAPALMGDLTG
jgi:hypothetical protein